MSLGDLEASIAAAKQALEIKPNYPPAVLTMGSIEYQRGREAEGKKLLLSLMSLPDDAGDLWEVIDKVGSFLIERRKYADGRELYRGAVERFPRRAVLYQGLGCCAGHEWKSIRRKRNIDGIRKGTGREETARTMTDRFEINPKVMLGKSVIRGTCIPVELILRKLSE